MRNTANDKTFCKRKRKLESCLTQLIQFNRSNLNSASLLMPTLFKKNRER
jgi:hypothetical protein